MSEGGPDAAPGIDGGEEATAPIVDAGSGEGGSVSDVDISETGPGTTQDGGTADVGSDTIQDGASTSSEGSSAFGDAAGDSGGDGSMQEAGGPCASGTSYPASNAAGSRAQVTGYGFIDMVTSAKNQIVALETTLAVPPKPPASGTLFLWPGLQPDGPGSMDLPIDNGVLQPVLTWGPTCAPNAPNGNAYASWWISAQYVNTYIAMSSPDYTAYGGCHGGPGMNVDVADSLNISMTLSGTSWVQTVTDVRSGQSVTYALDMMGQIQDIAEFDIEEYSQAPVADVIFTSTALTFASSQPAACQPEARGTNDYFSAPQASSDGLRCCVQTLILRAEGVAATSPDSP